MKIKTARSVLSITWVSGSVPIIVIVALQTFNQVYGDTQNWDKGWLWIMPLLFPVLGTIIGSWTVGQNESDNIELKTTFPFYLTFILSISYFFILYGALIIGAVVYKHSNWDYLIRSTSWFLGAFQALLSLALTKFFIENIRPTAP